MLSLANWQNIEQKLFFLEKKEHFVNIKLEKS
jgi:hypothetical protein